MNQPELINEAESFRQLNTVEQDEDPVLVREIMSRARKLKGLKSRDVEALISVKNPNLLSEPFDTVRGIKEAIYGPRIVLFASLHISDLCRNACPYRSSRATNKEMVRRVLTREEIAEEVRILVEQGHKRILLVSGESYPDEGFSHILKSIATIYSVHSNRGEIRRANVNIAPPGRRPIQAAQRGRHRDVAALPGNIPPRNIRLYASRRDGTRLRMACFGLQPRDAGGNRRRWDGCASGPVRLEIRNACAPPACGAPGESLRRRPAHNKHSPDRTRGWIPGRHESTASGQRHGLPENRGQFAHGHSLRRHYYVYAGGTCNQARHPRPGRFPDFHRKSRQSRWLRSRNQESECSVPMGRPAFTGRDDTQPGGNGLYPVILRDMLQDVPDRRAFHGTGQTGRHKVSVRPQYALSPSLENPIDHASSETWQAGETLISTELGLLDDRRRADTSKMLEQVRAERRDVYI